MAVIRNPYDPGTPVPLPTYTGAPGDWSAMMKWKPWKLLDRYQDPTFNPQWLPDLAPWILPEEKVKDDIPIVKTTVADEWVDPDIGGNGINGTNGNGTTGTTGTDTGTDTGIDTGTAIDQGLIDAQALVDAQAAALADEQAQALAAQQAADALASQQAADAQAASDALLEQQRQEDERIRQEQEAAAEERQALEDTAYGRVSTAKDEWGKEHWETSGKSEGRDLPGDFGDYVESYPALKEAYLEHRKSLKAAEEETETVTDTPRMIWSRKDDGTWGWVWGFDDPTATGVDLSGGGGPFTWVDPDTTGGGISTTGYKDYGTQLAGASGYPRWEPDNPTAKLTPSSMGAYYFDTGSGRVNTGLRMNFQHFLDYY